MDPDEITRRVTYHPPATAERVAAHGVVRSVIGDAMSAIAAATPVGREQSLAITKLEEAMFWANAAIARQSDDG